MYVLFIGAHPDDCDFAAGGTAALMARRGHHVRFLSVTNGDRGYMRGDSNKERARLAERRMGEARRAVKVIGGDFECLNVPDGEVYVTKELTERMIRAIRSWGPRGEGPDLVITNRPNDYHRDHRYTSQLVLDSSYLLTVPLMCPDVTHLRAMPVIAYWFDSFREGGVFRPHAVVSIDTVMGTKVEMAVEHASQIFEWLPFNAGTLEQVPAAPEARQEYARERMERRSHRVANACLELAPHLVPDGCRFAEAFQISEYGREPKLEELGELFPLRGA